MTRTRLFPFFLLQIVCVVYAVGIDMSKVNLTYQYDPESGIQFAHRVVEEGGQIKVIYKVTTDTINHWDQTFLIQDEYNSVAHDTLRAYTLDTLFDQGEAKYFQLTMSKTSKSLLLIAWYDLNRGVYKLEDVRVSSPVGFPSFYPVDEQDVPVLTNYVSGPIKLKGDLTSYHSYAYLDNFGPADPAMGRMRPIAPSLEIDSSFFFDGQLSQLAPYHFYLIQEDSTAQNGLTLLNCPDYYPAQRRIEELVPPLTYISTESELNTLKNKMSKGAFESFWVNTYGSRFRAKSAIRNFYNRVETVNRLFTDYKQGWKTDRGVIYLIFGKPDKVFRSERSEVWQYITGEEFEFIRISTLFTSSMYTLKRDREYEQVWYNQVGELRKGM